MLALVTTGICSSQVQPFQLVWDFYQCQHHQFYTRPQGPVKVTSQIALVIHKRPSFTQL
ncbi:unnamed protein product [Coffea canephora]|uniref:Uncharacterized protein n=1 Tax=Coffea canephora TaxID=49390 RepID=A0A068UD62_COFCA|nr:unnamed protein product [Coffea canephora]